ncbi:MAG TPA: acyl-CoA dehydrogenase family protein [Streptosporangiaceae bacterium]|nr:acyl-CoA dehydrogenase family protein [Streptosporangiaceae bacterium]
MDFTRSEAEVEVSRLAAQVVGSGQNDAAGTSTDDFNAELWKELGQAGLLSLALPAELGGDELGVQATAAVLTEVGRQAARIPALATLALGVLPVARSADILLKQQLLAGVASGETVLTAAIREPSDPMPASPRTRMTLQGAGRPGTVSGLKVGVPYAAAATWILVPATVDVSARAGTAAAAYSGTTVVAVIEPDADGLSCQRTRSSSGLPEYTLRLDETPAAYVLDRCDAADLYRLAVAGACAVGDGALAAALQLTTEHVRNREQFGRPLATFQAVAQQIADVYAAARTLHLATLSACWQLDAERDAGRDTDVAAYWLAHYGPMAVRTCHHLHGGLGMDISYPLPRYSALITDLVAFVGGEEDRLDRLGEREATGA